MSWWVHSYYQAGGALLVFSWAVWVIGSIVLHELAHGWAALWQGDTTPRDRGHLTINPLVHMPGFALIMFAVVGITWGLMPVNPSRFRDGRWGHALVALAGPAMNVALAVVALVAAGLVTRFADQTVTTENLLVFLTIGGTLNLVLAAFNLVPAPPLDGSVILAAFSRTIRELFDQQMAPMIGMMIMIVILMSGLIEVAFTTAFRVSLWTIGIVAGA